MVLTEKATAHPLVAEMAVAAIKNRVIKILFKLNAAERASGDICLTLPDFSAAKTDQRKRSGHVTIKIIIINL